MIKLRSIILLFIVLIISFISIHYDINLLYPYYFIKDLLLSPVSAINSKELTLSNTFKDSLITGLKEEINRLERLNSLSLSLNDFDYIKATIIERNREYWFNTITINKGKSDGIEIDMAVIDSNGLIGRVSKVSSHLSEIKLITTNDTNNKVSAVIKDINQDIYGIIEGYDSKNNLLNFTVINNKKDIPKNSLVVTTGMGGVFPSDILIGKVADIIIKEDGVTNILRIIPSSNLDEERYVMVLKRKELFIN
jgi:rod shape-determining protein MreC